MDVLVHLANHAGAVVTTEELISAVWSGRVVGDSAVYERIRKLRRALGDNHRAPRFIETIPKRGYRLLVPVEHLPPSISRTTHRFLPERWQQLVAATATLVAVVVTVSFLSHISTRRTDAFTSPPTIAVLPFVGLSRNEAVNYLGEAVADELIHALSSDPGLRVVARTSSFQSVIRDLDIREIGRRLGAAAILDGSVQVKNGRVEVTAQLIDSGSGYNIWSETSTEPMEELVRMERRIALAVAHQLLGDNMNAVRITAALPAPAMISSYEYYLLGRQRMRSPSGLVREWSPADAAQAIDYFRRAIAADPTFARAYTGLADALLLSTVIGGGFASPEPASQALKTEVTSAISQALALDPDLAEVRTSQALFHRLLDGDDHDAEVSYREAVALNPNIADAHFRLGLLIEDSNPDEAIVELRKALTLDPLSTGVALWLGKTLYTTNRHDEAVPVLEQVIRREPGNLEANWWLGKSLDAIGQSEEALAHYQRAQSLDHPIPGAFIRVAIAQRSAGHPDEAARMLSPLVEATASRAARSSIQAFLASLYLDLDDFSSAETLIRPIADTEEATNTRVQVALARNQIGVATELIHAWKSSDPNEFCALYEMVIGHDRHAEELYSQIASKVDLLSLSKNISWGYYPPLNAAHLLLKRGEIATADALLAVSRDRLLRLLEEPHAASGASYLLASIYAMRGDTEHALAYLRDAVDSGWTRHWFAPIDPNLVHLRDNSDFQALIDRVRADMAILRPSLPPL